MKKEAVAFTTLRADPENLKPKVAKTMEGPPQLTVFRGWDAPGRHVWSPFVVKLEARLRFAGVKYAPAAGSPTTAPRGKIPYVELRAPPPDARWAVREQDGEQVASLGDSRVVIESLAAAGSLPDVNARLSPEERAFDLALRTLLEDRLYFCHVC